VRLSGILRSAAARSLAVLRGAGVLPDPGAWVVERRLLACAYPRRESALASLRARGVSVLVNLHERAHPPARLARHGLSEVHVPVRDFTAPAPAQIDRALAAIDAALAEGSVVALHCGGGLGRTGTVAACFLAREGRPAADAIAAVRRLRPGSVETREQEAAVEAFLDRIEGTAGRAGPPRARRGTPPA
jgi:atypical dual specificity phosphatase